MKHKRPGATHQADDNSANGTPDLVSSSPFHSIVLYSDIGRVYFPLRHLFFTGVKPLSHARSGAQTEILHCLCRQALVQATETNLRGSSRVREALSLATIRTIWRILAARFSLLYEHLVPPCVAWFFLVELVLPLQTHEEEQLHQEGPWTWLPV